MTHVDSLLDEEVRYQASVITGEDAVLALARDIDRLAASVDGSLSSRAVWTMPSVHGTGDDAWAVAVRCPAGRLAAVAVFVDRIVDEQRTVTLAGTEGGFATVLPGTASAARRELVDAVAEQLAAGRSAADLGPVRGPGDVLAAVRDALGGAAVLVDEPIPNLLRTDGPELTAYLSHNMRKTLRRAANHLRADGRDTQLAVLSRVDEVRAALPQLAAAHRDRDHAKGRTSQLDSPAGRRAWELRLLELVSTGWGEVVTLLVDDGLVAYVVGVRDGDRYGIREGRFLTTFSRYAPGRLLEAAVVQRALQDPSLAGVDWLSSVAPESLLATNGADRAVRLVVPAPADHIDVPRQRAGVPAAEPA